MITINELIFVLVSILVIYFFYIFVYDGTTTSFCSIDNEYYKIRRGPDAEQRVKNLALIKLKLETIVKSLEADTRFNSFESVKRLIRNWNTGITIKEIGLLESDAAYVIDKQNMSFCLRKSPSGGELESLNLLTYVAIHELAHVMSIETGHSKEFQENFKFLLEYSKTLSFKNPIDGTTEPLYVTINPETDDSAFCGVEITPGAIK
jgi:hypothetical protein